MAPNRCVELDVSPGQRVVEFRPAGGATSPNQVATEARIGGVSPDAPQDTLLIVEPISLAAGQAVTVVLLDKAGGRIDAVVMRDC